MLIFRTIVAQVAIVLFAATRAAGDPPELQTPIAIKSITVVTAPGQKVEAATILIDKERIVAVGKDVAIPLGTLELDGTGLFAYAGFIDAFTRTGVKDVKPTADEERRIEDEFESVSDGPRARSDVANRNGIFARRHIEDLLDIQDKTYEDARKSGFTAALVAPPKGVIGGRASVLALGDRPVRRSLLLSGFAQTASFEPPGQRALRDRIAYPSTTFGVIAHFRQVMNDSDWYERMGAYVGRHPESRAELPYDLDLEALLELRGGKLPLIWEADDFEQINRALNLSEEYRLKPILVGARQAYKVVDRLKATGAPVFVSLKLPKKPDEYKLDVAKTRRATDDTTIYGKNWEKRPFESKAAYAEALRERDEELGNAARLEAAGLTWCVTAFDQKKPEDALYNLRDVITAGLPADAALKALTTTPAKLLGLEKELGTIEPGKRANLAVFNKPFHEKEAKLRWTFVDGKQYDVDDAPGAARKRGPRKDDKDAPDKKEADKKDDDRSGEAAVAKPADSQPASKPSDKKKDEPPPGPLDDILLHEANWAIETDKDRDPGVHTGGSVLLKNATVLTVSGDDIENASVLIEKGKIKAVGKNVAAPAGVETFDLTGCVVMPGVFDGHAHIALDSVNEGALSVTPEVRCEDVVRSDDLDIYYALAGGTTTIHAMHGSANTIGGQNVILKLKYGRPAADLIVRDRHRTVKFATGENVKRGGLPQPGWLPEREGRVRRFPGTRMGVEATMRRALFAGREYADARAEYDRVVKAGEDVKPLRRDLRLEALADIVGGDIWVNCHCYRADEILRVLSTAEDFGFRVNNLHHVLEGYRIMPEIARHGCGTVTFSDWWAYKVEAYEAVPYNAGMLMRYGVNSTIKSDSSDLMRHLQHEAAKCLKYSSLTTNEALRLVTLNVAKQFGLQDRLGSIDVGKDGDIAVFDGHPLDTFSKCVLTLVEGEVYFRHRDFDPQATKSQPRPMKSFTAAHRGDGAPALAAALDSTPGATNGHGSNGAAGTNGSNGHTTTIFAITNATIHPVSKPAIEDGTLLIQDGKIAAVGRGFTIPAGATTIDARGLHVWPGLINAASTVGLSEIGQVDVTNDMSEPGTYQPDLRAVSAFNPHSAMVEVARADGVTTIMLIPDAPTVAGQAGLLDLNGWTMAEMLIDGAVAPVVNLSSKRPDNLLDREKRPNPEWDEEDKDKPDDDRTAKSTRELRDLFRNAKLYATAVRAAAAKHEKQPLAADPRYDALIPYVLGEKPVLFPAETYKSILEALLFADQCGLKPIILGGRDAWKLADLLAKRQVPVIYDRTFTLPGGVASVRGAAEAWDANYRAAGIMQSAGVKFCIANRSASLAKLVSADAGFAVSHGLDADAAVRAITLAPAEILGIADRYGSLDVGKVANVIVTTDHVCQASDVVKYVFIRGQPVQTESKHTREAAKFAGRPNPALPPARTDLKGPPSQTTAAR